MQCLLATGISHWWKYFKVADFPKCEMRKTFSAVCSDTLLHRAWQCQVSSQVVIKAGMHIGHWHGVGWHGMGKQWDLLICRIQVSPKYAPMPNIIIAYHISYDQCKISAPNIIITLATGMGWHGMAWTSSGICQAYMPDPSDIMPDICILCRIQVILLATGMRWHGMAWAGSRARWNCHNQNHDPPHMFFNVKFNFKASLFSSTFWFERSFRSGNAILVFGPC